eukprot:m.55441 g.55441  ORF g.55441 m.55441 type:complete len:332 (-) comp22070_c0_seq1:46-1041(-)
MPSAITTTTIFESLRKRFFDKTTTIADTSTTIGRRSSSPNDTKLDLKLFAQKDNLLKKQSITQSLNPIDFLTVLPEEVALLVIQKLGIDDIKTLRRVCKAWNVTANSDQVWRYHCTLVWSTISTKPSIFPSWKQMYKSIRYACQMANRDGVENAFEHFHAYGLIGDDAAAKASLLNDCVLFQKSKVGVYLSQHPDEMGLFFKMQRFEQRTLPDSLRMVFSKARFPNSSSLSLAPILKMFVQQYTSCNSKYADESNNIHVLCYSVILLGVDLHNPNIKSKMTKREFIKNNRRIIPWDQDYFGDLYDDVYLHGHVAEPRRDPIMSNALKALTM